MRLRFSALYLLFCIVSLVSYAQTIQQSFTGTVYISSGGGQQAGLFGTPSGTVVSGTLNINTGEIGAPLPFASGATLNTWQQTVLGGVIPGDIPANNTDSITIVSAFGSFTATDLQSIRLATTGYDLQFSLQPTGTPSFVGAGGGLAISSYAGDPALPITLAGAFPLSLTGGHTGLITLNNNGNENFIEINITTFLGKGCAAGVTLLPRVPSAPFMTAEFTSPAGEDIATFARTCNFDSLNWQQIVTDQPPVLGPAPRYPSLVPNNVIPAFCAALPPVPDSATGLQPQGWAPDCRLFATPSQPFYDPPPGDYDYTPSDSPALNSYPFYYKYPIGPNTCTSIDPAKCLPSYNPQLPTVLSADGTTIRFIDAPSNSAFVDHPIHFKTTLVGVSVGSPSGSVPCAPFSIFNCTALSSFEYASNYYDHVGGIIQQGVLSPVSATGGTGSVVVTAINGTQLPTPIYPSQLTTVTSGLVYSRVSQTFSGIVTIKNVSSDTISGPLQLFLFGMNSGVVFMNATSNVFGTPYLTIPAESGVAPGQSITVDVQFKNPSNATISFSPAIYSGSVN